MSHPKAVTASYRIAITTTIKATKAECSDSVITEEMNDAEILVSFKEEALWLIQELELAW